MLMFTVILVFLSVTLMIAAFGARMAMAPRRAAVRRLKDLRPTTYNETLAAGVIVAPPSSGWMARLLPFLKPQEKTPDLTAVGLNTDSSAGRLLLYAGYRSRAALRNFHLSRLATALALAAIPLLLSARKAVSPESAFLLMAVLGMAGYILPKMVVRMQARRRQHTLKLSLPDALDLLVVCVEAGMGLNQALVRVSEELHDTHPDIADEFRLVNLEIRAGRTRPEALRSLGERTGVDDIISLAAMIIQTDKFGTSIARSLRVHSDCLRTERRQRAEEAAAKTTIKLIFPLLFCIFPSLFVIILGPAALHLIKIFGENR
jgi:tight adherence protein C